MSTTPRPVRIDYHRPPDRDEVFHQILVHEGDALVTYLAETAIPGPLVVDRVAVLEAGSPAVWFTFPDAWHDIGRFHLPDGTFTGLYANILTPVRMEGDRWRTTDLCLDVFVTPAGHVHVLDQDELARAEAAGWIEPELAERAREEADRLVGEARRGAWPPAIVHGWPLERARSAAGPVRGGHSRGGRGVSGSSSGVT